MKPNSDLYYSPPRIPEIVKKYMKYVMENSLRGRDGEYCSQYMQEKLDEFSWQAHGLQKPTLKDFSLWGRSVGKRGLDKNGKRKSRKKEIHIKEHIKQEIISDVIAYIGRIKDSFIGSPVFDLLYKKYKAKYRIDISIFAEILISKRKRTFSKEQGIIYCYQPNPITKPGSVKIGFTRSDPKKRMEDATRNTRTEHPKLLGFFNGPKSAEKEILNYELFSKYKCKLEEYGNREMFIFPDLKFIIHFMKSKITECGGIIY